MRNSSQIFELLPQEIRPLNLKIIVRIRRKRIGFSNHSCYYFEPVFIAFHFYDLSIFLIPAGRGKSPARMGVLQGNAEPLEPTFHGGHGSKHIFIVRQILKAGNVFRGIDHEGRTAKTGSIPAFRL